MKRHPNKANKGETYIWGSGIALAAILAITVTLVGVVIANGFAVFWPARLTELELADGSKVLGEVVQTAPGRAGQGRRLQLKIGNRDLYGLDFRWLDGAAIRHQRWPAAAVALERQSYGPFLGYYRGLAADPAAGWDAFTAAWERVHREAKGCAALQKRLNQLNAQAEAIRLKLLRHSYKGNPESAPAVAALLAKDARLKAEFATVAQQHAGRLGELRGEAATFADAGGRTKVIPLLEIVRATHPNTMPLHAKLRFYAGKVWELLFAEPRESNTEGGLFPAIVGTVMMVFLMSIFSFPLGVITAVYLREYATDGPVVRLVRIAVNNLAGIPSIVYGIFGLGFFVYGIGGSLDRLLFPERLPTPTFGTGGILWASLTLALLTVPVVIVATEEALSSIPDGIRAGSLALGATKLQTVVRILLPMASPGILTGFILAMARAAGEVAPLMITGVVKLAPTLPLDGSFPFLHLNRKFMHLGFHIYDIGFQSPNVEAAKPMVFVTTFLLVLIVLVLSSTAIHLRNKMKQRYTLTGF
ncbi:MAG: phosphate ABC transporter permease PstA [Lentisphaeria bacterium]|jgi:phosphate transport system permease protein